MNNIEIMLKDSKNIQTFSKNYFGYLFRVAERLDMDAVAAFAVEMEEARQNSNTVFCVGNGGSAATASHMANDFGTDIQKRTKTDLPLRVLSLTDNAAVILAVANDVGYDNIFVKQLEIHYRPGDKLIAVSASGNSSNVVAAAKWVKSQEGKVMSFTGFAGGELKEISDITIHVNTDKGEYGPVEDIHLIMGHLLSYWMQYQIHKNEKAVCVN
ncbi:MAG: SIS domain-containing protein [Candidatus Omnitrophota bacterium]